MYEVKNLSEYETRNATQFEKEYLAEREFQRKQNDKQVYVSLWKDGKCVKFAEKICNKWHVTYKEA